MTRTKITLKDGKSVIVNQTVEEVTKKLSNPDGPMVSFVDEKGEGAAVPFGEVATVETYRPSTVNLA